MLLIIIVMLISGLFINGTIPLVGQLNSNVAGLGSPGPNDIIQICNRAKCLPDLVTLHFFIVCL